MVGEIARAKRPVRLPVVMTRPEVDSVLSELDGIWRLMASLLYGSGLRLLECASLRAKDLDFGGGQLLVRRGKGQKDRATLLPQTLVAPLEAHLVKTQARHELDLEQAAGHVQLPEALSTKYPSASRASCCTHRWPQQASELSHVPAFVRNASAGSRLRYPDDSEAARAPRSAHDDGLHSRAQSRAHGCEESARLLTAR